jgi:outer membrane protein assembly factor BamB
VSVRRRTPSTWLLATLAVVAFVVGCSSKKDKAEPPAKLVEFKQTLDVRKLWSHSVGGGYERLRLGLRPASDGARIFAGSVDGHVASYDAATGREVWAIKTKLPLSAGPGYGDGVLAFGSSDGDLIAIDAGNGMELWRLAIGSEVLASPAIGSGVIVVRTVDGRLRGFSAREGKTIWNVEQTLPALTLRGNSAPRVAGNVVVAGFNNGRVGAFEIANGDQAWEVAIANPQGRTELERLVDISQGMQILANEVYVVGYHGRVVGIDVGTGVVLWQQDMSSYAGLSADFTSVYVTNDVDAVIALDRRAGAQVWRQEALRLRDVTAPTRFGNAVVVGDFEGYLHWLDMGDGHFVAREHAAKGRISAAPLVVGENLFVQGDDGTVAAFTVKAPKS